MLFHTSMTATGRLIFMISTFAFTKPHQLCCPMSNSILPNEISFNVTCLDPVEPPLKCASEYITVIHLPEDFSAGERTDVKIIRENGIPIKHDKYCIGKLKNNQSRFVALYCENDCQNVACRVFQYSLEGLKIISTFTLFSTVTIYMMLRKLRDLQGSCLLNFLLCFVFVYLSSVYDLLLRQLIGYEFHQLKIIYPTVGYIFHFFVLSSFGWLFISVFNAWKNLMSWNSHYILTYIMYLSIVYGGTTVILVLQFSISNEQAVFPKKRNSFWFDINHEKIWFYLPIEISLGMAALLLIDCGRRAWQICINNVDNVPAVKTILKNCFTIFKLYVTVGSTWITAILSTNDQSTMGTLLQLLIAVQGILIFIVLIITEKKTMRALGDTEHYGCSLFPTTWTPVNNEVPSQPRYYSQNEEMTDVNLTLRPSRTVVGRRRTSLGG